MIALSGLRGARVSEKVVAHVLRSGVADALTRPALAAHRTIVGHLVRRHPAAKRELSRHLLEIQARIARAGAGRRRLPRVSLGP